MRLRYYMDPATGQPHIYRHNVQENEVEELLAKPIEDRVGTEGSRVAIGQTEAGSIFGSFTCPILNQIRRS